jgi:hypothetical protein
MRNKFLTIQVWRFLYHMARKNVKRKAKPLSRPMTDVEWNEITQICKDLNIDLCQR